MDVNETDLVISAATSNEVDLVNSQLDRSNDLFVSHGRFPFRYYLGCCGSQARTQQRFRQRGSTKKAEIWDPYYYVIRFLCNCMLPVCAYIRLPFQIVYFFTFAEIRSSF